MDVGSLAHLQQRHDGIEDVVQVHVHYALDVAAVSDGDLVRSLHHQVRRRLLVARHVRRQLERVVRHLLQELPQRPALFRHQRVKPEVRKQKIVDS